MDLSFCLTPIEAPSVPLEDDFTEESASKQDSVAVSDLVEDTHASLVTSPRASTSAAEAAFVGNVAAAVAPAVAALGATHFSLAPVVKSGWLN